MVPFTSRRANREPDSLEGWYHESGGEVRLMRWCAEQAAVAMVEVRPEILNLDPEEAPKGTRNVDRSQSAKPAAYPAATHSASAFSWTRPGAGSDAATDAAARSAPDSACEVRSHQVGGSVWSNKAVVGGRRTLSNEKSEIHE